MIVADFRKLQFIGANITNPSERTPLFAVRSRRTIEETPISTTIIEESLRFVLETQSYQGKIVVLQTL